MKHRYRTLEIPFASPAFDEALRLRNDILRVPLNLEFYPEDIAREYEEIHLGCYDEGANLVGCLTLRQVDRITLKMRQVAVAESVQMRGIGKKMVEDSEEWAVQHGFRRMELNAREVAVPFYRKLHYEVVGERFEEVGIPHFKMKKDLI